MRKLKAIKGRPVVIRNIVNRTTHDLSGKALIRAPCSDTNQNTRIYHDRANCSVTRCWCGTVSKISIYKAFPEIFKNVPIYLFVYFLIIIHDLFNDAVSCAVL
jgi:hypothetical protein